MGKYSKFMFFSDFFKRILKNEEFFLKISNKKSMRKFLNLLNFLIKNIKTLKIYIILNIAFIPNENPSVIMGKNSINF